MKPTQTWILVCNGTHAMVTRNLGPGKGIEPVPGLQFEGGESTESSMFSDRPGRTFDSHGQGRHILESSSNPKREAKFQFAQTISDRLHKELSENKFDRLIVIAPPLMLGNLRKMFSKQLSSRISGEIHKDLTHTDLEDIVDHITDYLAA